LKKIDKIIQFLENHRVSFSSFEQKAKLGSSYLTKTRDRGVDLTWKSLEKIRQNAPDDYYKIFPEEKEPVKEPVAQTLHHEEAAMYAPGQPMKVIEDLSETTRKLSESILLSEKNIDRILSIVEKVMNMTAGMDLPNPGDYGTIDLKDEKKSKKKDDEK